MHRIKRLDNVTSTALTKICSGEIGRGIRLRSAHALETEVRIPKGKGLWYIIAKYFGTCNNAEAVYSMKELQ